MRTPKIFVMDLDCTLTNECEGYGYDVYMSRTPYVKMIEQVRKLVKRGDKIIIHTSRYECDRKVTEQWLKKHNVPYDELVMGKPIGSHYVDDRGMDFDVFKLMEI